MGFMALTDTERQKLEYEVVSDRARLLLTRLLRHATRRDNPTLKMIYQNNAVNIARNALGLPIYKLEAEDGDYYYPSEYGWHNAEIELVLRRPETSDLVEILADLIQEGILLADEVNDVLEKENLSFSFRGPDSLDEGKSPCEFYQ